MTTDFMDEFDSATTSSSSVNDEVLNDEESAGQNIAHEALFGGTSIPVLRKEKETPAKVIDFDDFDENNNSQSTLLTKDDLSKISETSSTSSFGLKAKEIGWLCWSKKTVMFFAPIVNEENRSLSLVGGLNFKNIVGRDFGVKEGIDWFWGVTAMGSFGLMIELDTFENFYNGIMFNCASARLGGCFTINRKVSVYACADLGASLLLRAAFRENAWKVGYSFLDLSLVLGLRLDVFSPFDIELKFNKVDALIYYLLSKEGSLLPGNLNYFAIIFGSR